MPFASLAPAGKHRDAVENLEPDSPILSISLGQQRTFRVKDHATNGKQLKKDFEMPDRSYLVMGGKMQVREREGNRVTGVPTSSNRWCIHVLFPGALHTRGAKDRRCKRPGYWTADQHHVQAFQSSMIQQHGFEPAGDRSDR